MDPAIYFKCLANETSLMCLLLIEKQGELCVCDLTDALNVSQPKISRHLASLRKNNIVSARKKDQWVYYRINPDLDPWAQTILSLTQKENRAFMSHSLKRLENNRINCC